MKKNYQLIDDVVARCWPRAVNVVSIRSMPGGASNRRYLRVSLTGDGPKSLVAMVLPKNAGVSEEVGHNGTATELPFLNVQRYLADRNLPVPILHYYDVSAGVLLLEDLGDTTFERDIRAQPDSRLTRYREAIDLLVDFQHQTAARSDACIGFDKAFTVDMLRWELEHFREFGTSHEFNHDEQETWLRCRDTIVEHIVSTSYCLCHRDYQSRNLMWTERGLVMIDFQDCLMGPRTYDLVALLRDSYVELSTSEVSELLKYYLDTAMSDSTAAERHDIQQLFYWNTVQRKLKDAGRFFYIEKIKGDASFLAHYPSSIQYVVDALEQLPAISPLRALIENARREIK